MNDKYTQSEKERNRLQNQANHVSNLLESLINLRYEWILVDE